MELDPVVAIDGAHADVVLFGGASSGETPELKVYGFNAGAGGVQNMQIGVGVDAPDRASFDGVGTYSFDGSVLAASLITSQLSADPSEPASGDTVIWASDGTGKGDAGDVMIASNVGGTTKYGTLFDYSGGAAW